MGEMTGKMTGRLDIVGLGPGDPALLTPQALDALDRAEELVGYGPYLARIPERAGRTHHGSDNRVELDRARHALAMAAAGRRVAVVSGGDPGVFAMASAVFEAMEGGEPEWRDLDVAVLPGVSAMFAAAARLGAPLGHDFCAVSLSDNLKPWETVLARLRAAAGAGFVLALYNPASRARPWQLGAALDALREVLPGRVPVAFATAVTRPDEVVRVVPLQDADPAWADMRTVVMVGSVETRAVGRWLYTPRSAT